MTKRNKILFMSIFLACIVSCCYIVGQRLRHERLDRQLIEALRSNDSATALAALSEGADANARELPNTQFSLLTTLKSLFQKPVKSAMLPTAMPALLVAIDWRWRDVANKGEFRTHLYSPTNPPDQDPNVIRALLEHGADVNIVNEIGLSPLQIASWEGKSSTVRLLLEHGAWRNINAHSKLHWNSTPLVLAISGESITTARVLLEYHADINTIRDYDEGYTALALARELHDTEMVNLLEATLNKQRRSVSVKWRTPSARVTEGRITRCGLAGGFSCRYGRRLRSEMLPLFRNPALRNRWQILDVHEQEEAFVRHFIVAHKQERYLQFLSKPKSRGKFLDELYHRIALKGALAMELPPAKRTAVEVQQLLQRLGAKDMAYVISPYARIDQKWLPLTDVLTDVLISGSEVIVCCITGELAFVQTEDSAYILNDPPRKQAT